MVEQGIMPLEQTDASAPDRAGQQKTRYAWKTCGSWTMLDFVGTR
jgi:hypothetical protein